MFDRESNEPSSTVGSRRLILRSVASLAILIGAGGLLSPERHGPIRFGYGGELIATASETAVPDSRESEHEQHYGEYGYGGTQVERRNG